ncbi:MAG: hypothetical protein JWL74_442 [Alphaproteobacteria bacterium]|nr:hypothetical protein [Alphaproteobacteria bacterium]
MTAAPARSAEPPFSGSYAPGDVTFLLKPAQLAPVDVATKEALIQSGKRHYSEMLSPESPPGEDYLRLYEEALARNGARLAQDVVDLAAFLAERSRGREEVVIASLARAGTPIGVLLRRALLRLGKRAPHYSISIIRDRGIDREALRHIAARHDPSDVVFVDGWTGKGTITRELRASLADRPYGFEPFLAVVADPAGCADVAASDEDYLIPSGLLNAIVSGLVSRSVLNDDLVGPGDFHACVHYRHLAPQDRSSDFVMTIDALMTALQPRPIAPRDSSARAKACTDMVEQIMAGCGLSDRNRIKPGVAEATRAVLRRIPDRLLIKDPMDPDVAHLVLLARERGVTIHPLPGDHGYRAVAVIRSLGLD